MSSFLKRAKYCGVGLLHPSTDTLYIYVLCTVKGQYSFRFKWHISSLILLEKNIKLNIAIIEQTIICFGVTPFTNFTFTIINPWTSYKSIQLSSIQSDTGLRPIQTFWINKEAHKWDNVICIFVYPQLWHPWILWIIIMVAEQWPLSSFSQV